MSVEVHVSRGGQLIGIASRPPRWECAPPCLPSVQVRDSVRVNAFAAALRRVSAGKTLCDLGSGPFCLLSRLALGAGASRVTAIEHAEDAARAIRCALCTPCHMLPCLSRRRPTALAHSACPPTTLHGYDHGYRSHCGCTCACPVVLPTHPAPEHSFSMRVACVQPLVPSARVTLRPPPPSALAQPTALQSTHRSVS